MNKSGKKKREKNRKFKTVARERTIFYLMISNDELKISKKNHEPGKDKTENHVCE